MAKKQVAKQADEQSEQLSALEDGGVFLALDLTSSLMDPEADYRLQRQQLHIRTLSNRQHRAWQHIIVACNGKQIGPRQFVEHNSETFRYLLELFADALSLDANGEKT